VIVSSISTFATVTAFAEDTADVAQRTLLDETATPDPKKPEEKVNASGEKVSGFPFSIGTLLGVSFALYDIGKYRVNSDRTITKFDDESIVMPAVYAMPSLALVSILKRPLAAIVPVGMTGREIGDLAAGLGLSWGDFGKYKDWNVGLALAVVVTSRGGLNKEQRQYLNNGQPLPDQASTTFDRRPITQLVAGFYLAPKL
jgi:hypothetical protein